ncbi:hypothetical protein F4777DRAFT_244694 [Nemania sp. FL0916]|nr:hypothetical protein F4777DRAFT_244694 [Nemania sp. FL0916]
MAPIMKPHHYLPSKAEPEERHARKRLEKDHSIGLTQVAILGLVGLKLAWDIEKQVEKKEEKKEKEEAEERRRRDARERQRREKAFHNGTFDPRRDYGAASSEDSRSRRSGGGGASTATSGRDYARDRDPRRGQSVGYRTGGGSRYEEDRGRYLDQAPRYYTRDGSRPYASQYDDFPRDRDLDRADRSRRRRDSR